LRQKIDRVSSKDILLDRLTDSFLVFVLGSNFPCVHSISLFNWLLSIHPKNIKSNLKQRQNSLEALIFILQAPSVLKPFIKWLGKLK